MAPSIPNCEPKSFTAGDTVEWTRIVGDYPPSEGWTLSYTLLLADKRVLATVTDDGVSEYTAVFAANDETLSEITAETEAQLVGRVTGSGDYDGKSKVVYDAPVTILPNPSETTLDGMRSESEIELEAVKAAILSITRGETASYTIGGRAATKLELPKLYQRQAMLESKIRTEKGYGFRQRKVAFV